MKMKINSHATWKLRTFEADFDSNEVPYTLKECYVCKLPRLKKVNALNKNLVVLLLLLIIIITTTTTNTTTTTTMY